MTQTPRLDSSKRSLLLGGRFEPRPPWSLPGELFFQACCRCGLCIEACPENILVTDRFRFPRVDFQLGYCSFCGMCREVCDSASVEHHRQSAFHHKEPPWSITVRISDQCLAARGVLCRTCGEECTERAITFIHQQGGVASPSVKPEKCTGCGACVRPCPTGAVQPG